MSIQDEQDVGLYEVVVNEEAQYSIWAFNKPVPAGWVKVGKCAEKADCLKYINDVWTDMRPRSLRIQMEDDSTKENKIPLE